MANKLFADGIDQAELTAFVATIIATINAKPKVKAATKHKPQSSYKAANKYQNVKAKSDKVLSDGKTERQISNDVAVAKAFKKAGFIVVPRVDALTYKGWLLKGMRVVPGQKGLFVKGVGTLFHSGQVATDVQPSKAQMIAEVGAMQQASA